MAKRSRGGKNRGGQSRGGRGRNDYERTDRVGELLREIIAEELVRIDDDELSFVTVTGVDVDRDLFRAHVFLSSLDLHEDDIEAVHQYRGRVRKAVARQAHLRKVPEIVFQLDPGLVAGSRVDELLRETNAAEGVAASDAGHMGDSGDMGEEE